MWTLRLVAVLCAVSLSACANLVAPRTPPALVAPRTPPADGPMLLAQVQGTMDSGDAADDADERVVEAPARPVEPAAVLPSNALTSDILYKLLMGEIAGQRGNLRFAAKAYLDIAQSTRDPRLARRAAEVAMYGKFNDLAREAAGLWVDIEPGSTQARQTLVSILVGSNRLGDAKPYLQKLISADKANVGASFIQLQPLLGRNADKTAVYNVVRNLAEPYPEVPEAQFALAQAALGAGKFDVAAQAVQKALELRPSWEPAALLNAQLLQREANAKAVAYLEAFLAANPQARDVRLNYARLLVAEKRIEPAREQFSRIEQETPDNADVAVTIGLLSLQLNDLDTAAAKFKRAIALNYRDGNTLRYYLGQIAEERKQADEALAWYGKVAAGEQVVPAAARYAFILARQNKVADARAHLQAVQARNPQQQVQLTQAEAQVLREARAYQESFTLLGSALEVQPDHPDLLYDYAMAAEKVDRLDLVEAKLKRLIELKPDHAQAYNALGYTFAERNIRLKEAREFIDKALKLSPQDPFILDSMGWVQYRLGNMTEGADFLRRAYTQRADPEIAAHLGEVLWAQGKKSEAEQLWRGSLRDNPASDELRSVIHKFLD